MKGLVKPSANQCGNVDLELPTDPEAAKRPERRNQDFKQPRRSNYPDRDARHAEDRPDRPDRPDRETQQQRPDRERTPSQRKRRSASRNRQPKHEEVYYAKKGEETDEVAAERRAPSRGKRQPASTYAKRDFKEDRYADRRGRASDRQRRSRSRDPVDSDYRPKRPAGDLNPKPNTDYQERRREGDPRPRRTDRQPQEAGQPEDRPRRAARPTDGPKPARDSRPHRQDQNPSQRGGPHRLHYRPDEPVFADSEFPRLT